MKKNEIVKVLEEIANEINHLGLHNAHSQMGAIELLASEVKDLNANLTSLMGENNERLKDIEKTLDAINDNLVAGILS